MTRTSRGRAARVSATGACLAALLLTSACGDGGDDPSGGGSSLGDEVRVVSINVETGPASFAGISANKGYEVAVDQINAEGFLGTTKMVLDKQDTTDKTQPSVQQLTAAIASKKYVAVFGSVSSGQAIAQAPIAEKAKMPILFTQAGSEGVVIGDYTFRLTPPMGSYFTKMSEYIKTLDMKTLGIVYAAWSPTLKEVAEETLPAMAKTDGFTIVSSVGTQQSTQDFSAPISQVLAAKPDIVAILQIGASNPTAVTQLRQAGYAKPVLANPSACCGNLKPAGADAADTVWPTDWSPLNEATSTQDFVKLYGTKFASEVPLAYAAEAYDAAWMLARAIKAAGSTDSSAVQEQLAKIAAAGFTGAMGDIKFEGNDARLPGVLVKWDGQKEVFLGP